MAQIGNGLYTGMSTGHYGGAAISVGLGLLGVKNGALRNTRWIKNKTLRKGIIILPKTLRATKTSNNPSCMLEAFRNQAMILAKITM